MKRNRKGMAFFIVVIIALIAVKAIWVSCSINGIGSRRGQDAGYHQGGGRRWWRL